MTRLEHLLSTIVEECNETGQRATKAMRFGIHEIQPDQSLTNSERLVYEFNDILAVMEMLLDEGHINTIIDRTAIELKKQKVEKYLKYAKECGTLND